MKSILPATTLVRPAGQCRHAAAAEDAMRAGRYRLAQRHARAAIAADPRGEHGYYWVARACLALEDYEASAEASRKALAACPDDEVLLVLHAHALRHAGRHGEALAAYRRCTDLYPGNAVAWTGYAIGLQTFSYHEQSRLAALMALSITPDNVIALMAYAKALKETGEPELAIDAVRRAIALAPDDSNPREMLVFLLLMSEHASALDLRAESEAVAAMLARRHASSEAATARKAVVPRPQGTRVRLGVLSNDIHRHACAYFLIPLLANLDRSRVEVVVFALNGFRDAVSERIAALADRFVSVANLPDAAVADAVRAEGLDALVDLGGYTGVSPLTFMVQGLAPVQLTWLGFPGGTGMPQIHYRITDAVADPPGYEAHYVETLLRAPGTFCTYAPLVQHPLRAYQADYQVAPTPALRNGHVTFGSCNNFGKLTARVLRLWQRVLARVPGSKLLVEAAGLDLEPVREDLYARMAQAGIGRDRLILRPRDTARQYLTYHDIDIVLDAFPLTGGTTTCDALWMGVPIVSLCGQAFHSRMSATFLQAVGLDWLVCHDEAAYAEAAVQLAADVAQLDALRMSIRPRFERSAIFDSGGFARWLEDQLVALTGRHRALGPLPGGDRAGLYYEGEWLSMPALGRRIATLLALADEGDNSALERLLERLCAKWPRHWLVAFALADQAHRKCELLAALELLMQAIGLFPSHRPLYRLLAAWLDEAGMERNWAERLVRDHAGGPIDMTSAVPDAATILTLQDDTTPEAT